MHHFFLNLTFLLLLLISSSFSNVQRIAVFIGNNVGLSHERPLKYATHDAQNLANVFFKTGDLEPDRGYVLKNKTATEIRSVLKEVNGRVKEIKRTGDKVIALIYYSGHGDSTALHIKGKRFALSEFTQLFDELEAELKFMIVDACESGSILRTKGGKIVYNYETKKQDSLSNKGTVVISSSSVGEQAQESENYKGAVFTHHLINGLNGVADYDNDKEVSLWEAYHYADVSTRSENIYGKINQQNPNFDMDLVGKSEVILTTLYKNTGGLLFKSFKSAVINIYNGINMTLKATIHLTGRDSIYFQLPAKEYLVTYEEGSAFKVAKINLSSTPNKTLSPHSFRTFSKSEVFQKGGRVITLRPHGAGISLSPGSIGPIEGVYMFHSNYQHKSYFFNHYAGFGFGSKSHLTLGKEQLSQKIFKVFYGIKKPVLRFNRFQLLLGSQASYYNIWQNLKDLRFEGNISEQKGLQTIPTNSNAHLFETDVSFVWEYFIGYGAEVYLGGSGSLQYYINDNGSFELSPLIKPLFGVSHRF